LTDTIDYRTIGFFALSSFLTLIFSAILAWSSKVMVAYDIIGT